MGLNTPLLGRDLTPESEQNGEHKTSEHSFIGNTLIKEPPMLPGAFRKQPHASGQNRTVLQSPIPLFSKTV